ncbi:hypothetical protein [Dyadobacter sp. LHD-138]|uniref:hypothetical protein n=1 Tax=Dyadobacter sp. LHD-138 TaxID=3071413 RepID=UPI0027DFBED3|nr:hypothetical protein [Dyadobacter sp. LHD-138]MDQ6481773.1 hypothetical protein [Dyadobacter sp. LHD-138]
MTISESWLADPLGLPNRDKNVGFCHNMLHCQISKVNFFVVHFSPNGCKIRSSQADNIDVTHPMLLKAILTVMKKVRKTTIS